MPSINDIRRVFIDFFTAEGHQPVASSPLVPRNDPSLLFTNAGMVQFKNVFTGVEKRPYHTAVSAQKCIRAGGKHNDLDNVGYTARHHTFFEMLGNFSFGDYFKERAIELAWRLVTREFGLSAEKLLVTIYSDDDEAFALWRKIAGLAEHRIIRISGNDNFWSMGETGPCGPCSEIFYDHGEEIAGGPPGSPDADGDRFVEIWNLVFMQYDQQISSGSDRRVALPHPSIDTGMGLERITAVLQHVHSNYEIDLFRALIMASEDFTAIKAEGSALASHRVIADHLRAAGFLIADGVMPGNEGRGYVLRRIMRRAMRHAYQLGARENLLARLVPVLISEMGQAYPELSRAEILMRETLDLEESRFRQLLVRGLKLLDDELINLPPALPLPGKTAFALYDTYGFPLDLTSDILRGQNRVVDQAGFDQAMNEQRRQARAAWAGSGETATDHLWFERRERFGATEFLGYDACESQGEILALLRDNDEVSEAAVGDTIALIANQSPFYGDAGGQAGDTGEIITATGHLNVETTDKKLGDLVVHRGTITAGHIRTGQSGSFRIDNERRDKVRANHSATHLLHEALRRILGLHVTQKGSLVDADRLRFDISHPKPLSAQELLAVEREVNSRIRVNSPVTTRLMSREDAIAAGAMALFGEKYDAEVRVLAMGQKPNEDRYSIELCGGTHVSRTGDIGLFRIVNESAIGAGLRRIEALTGEAALQYSELATDRLDEIAAQLKTAPDRLTDRIAQLLDERKKLERELIAVRKQSSSATEGTASSSRAIDGIKFVTRRVDGIPPRELKGMIDIMKTSLGSGVVAIAAVNDDKASLVVGVTDDLIQRYNAVVLVQAGVTELGGKGGGGRLDLAQAGGADITGIDKAFDAIASAMAFGNRQIEDKLHSH